MYFSRSITGISFCGKNSELLLRFFIFLLVGKDCFSKSLLLTYDRIMLCEYYIFFSKVLKVFDDQSHKGPLEWIDVKFFDLNF